MSETIRNASENAGEGLQEQIAAVTTFEELEAVLESVGRIKGSAQVYSADELIPKIQLVREQELVLATITRSEGLRDKVAELYIVEQIAKAESVDDVIKAIKTMYDAEYDLKTSSGEAYKMEELIGFINYVSKGELVEDYVTSNYGLRDKIVELRDRT